MGGIWTGLKATIGAIIAYLIVLLFEFLLTTLFGNISISWEGLGISGMVLVILVFVIIALKIQGIVLGLLWGWE